MYDVIERYAHRYSRNLADQWRGVTKVDAQSLEAVAQKTDVSYSLEELYPQMDPLVRVFHFMGLHTRESSWAIRKAKEARLALVRQLGDSLTMRQFEEIFNIDRYNYSGYRGGSSYYSRPYSRSEELGHYKGIIGRTFRRFLPFR